MGLEILIGQPPGMETQAGFWKNPVEVKADVEAYSSFIQSRKFRQCPFQALMIKFNQKLTLENWFYLSPP